VISNPPDRRLAAVSSGSPWRCRDLGKRNGDLHHRRVTTQSCQSRWLLTVVTANFAEFYARGRLDCVRRCRADRQEYFGNVSNLITFASVVILVWALLRLRKPIHRNVVLLAAFWRLAESAIFALITLNDFVVLRLLSGADYLRAFDTQQLQVLAYALVGAHDARYLNGLGVTAAEERQ
jgi:hypothetical protein